MILSPHNSSSPWNLDRALRPPLVFAALVCASILILILVFLAYEAWPLFVGGGWQAFIVDRNWYPMEGEFGLLPMLMASLAVMLGAVLLAAPLGLGCALFISFYARGMLQRGFRLLLSLLSGLPSVVLGLWGLTILVPLITQFRPPGASLLAAMLVLALMILPTVALTSAAALSAVPAELITGAAALGLTRKAQILHVALPAAKRRIESGVLLAMARALGETMAVLMVAGNVVQYPHGLFEPVRVLTANIALEMAYADGDHRAGLFASGLLLALVVLLLAGMAARMAGSAAHE